MHFVSKDQRPTIFPGHTITRGAVFYTFVFVSTFRRRTALHLDVLSTLRYTVFLDILFSDEGLDKTTFLNAFNGLLYT
jgi:hypothetical protein